MGGYNFESDLRTAKLAERAIDAFLEGQGWQVQPTPLWLDKLGCDRVITSRITGERRSVEYKSEWRGAETGNHLIEIIETTNRRPGWGYTSVAQQLLIWVPPRSLLIWLNFLVMRWHLNGWQLERPRRDIINRGWTNVGVLVPLSDLIELAMRIDDNAPYFRNKEEMEAFYGGQ